jgi:UDP-N-acetylmuramoyl-L-alanyl-D-glutamate--2,6-diaminopimelate ligase
MSMTLARLLPEQNLPPEVAELAVGDIQLDSRRLERGDLFLAMAGERSDGRTYIQDAIGAGAAAVLTEDEAPALDQRQPVPIIAVPDLRARAGELAGRFFGEPGRALRVFAITGTNGKTSTAWFLRDALQALGSESALLGTLGARCGGQTLETGHTTPDVISLHRWLRRFRDQGAQMLVMEASSHALAQNRLDGVAVQTAVFTNLSHEHLDYHGDMEAYYRAKALLFQRPELELAIINADDEAGRRLLAEMPAGVRILRFGRAADTDVERTGFTPTANGMVLTIRTAGETLDVELPLFGRFNADNVLAVAAVLCGLGHDSDEITTALAGVTPVPGRMEAADTESRPRVLVDYAHTPDALEKALSAAREHFRGRVICVTGAGGERDTAKRPVMAATAERFADRVVLTADNPRGEAVDAILEAMRSGLSRPDRVLIEPDRRLAVQAAVDDAGEEDVVLIAGKGHESWQEVRGEFLPMDDRELARAALAARGGSS